MTATRPVPPAPGLRLWPRLAAQALRTRRSALHLPEPPGPRCGAAGDGPPLRLLIAGDSSAAGVGAATQAEGLSGRLVTPLARGLRVTWRLEATTGHGSRQILARLTRLEPEPWDAAVVILGVNDATRLVPGALWARRQRAIHRVLRERFRVRRIYRTGIPPLEAFPLLPHPLGAMLGNRTARYEGLLAGIVAEAPDLVHIPFDTPPAAELMAQDGYHPGPRLYAEWGGRIAARILADAAAGGPLAPRPQAPAPAPAP